MSRSGRVLVVIVALLAVAVAAPVLRWGPGVTTAADSSVLSTPAPEPDARSTRQPDAGRSPDAGATDAGRQTASADESGPDTTRRSPQLPRTPDADAYATAVAALVFGMDTRALGPADYTDALLAEADPTLTATGQADLENLIDERVPADEEWARMRANAQWSGIEVIDVWQPGSWAQVVTAGQAQPGWALRNVTGIQTTHYFDAGAAQVTTRERTITIGMRCPAEGTDVDRCRLVLIGATVVP